jgi:hypothetical protein
MMNQVREYIDRVLNKLIIKAEENQRNILDQIRQGIVMFDKDTSKIEFANQAAFQFLVAKNTDAL